MGLAIWSALSKHSFVVLLFLLTLIIVIFLLYHIDGVLDALSSKLG